APARSGASGRERRAPSCSRSSTSSLRRPTSGCGARATTGQTRPSGNFGERRKECPDQARTGVERGLARLLPRPNVRAASGASPDVATVIALGNQKGGVAKTTTTLNLG